ncbi:hypothetical protein [Fictibacillus phosphorivorans]|uniref:hypothetical protein n=1 Tax=Fictibacillus phosphorivorans TaxID=1221500 RepID=UPI00203B34B9|nr:hypothetical protein [Fictibacillus phosphorivorans]MCM3718418.1 hypothetical protein [Fictibacillus phosphorivorans]MCM3776042.1 hypothetical protein [Fictibacillus phosphorivorans]
MPQPTRWMKLLKMWISIPRAYRMGFLNVLTLGLLVWFFSQGISKVYGMLTGSSTLTTPTIIAALIASLIILWVLVKYSKQPNRKESPPY